MALRAAINGFGRICRLVLRAVHESRCEDVEVVAINDLPPVETNAHLLRYDSVHGRFPGEITTGDNWIDIGRGKIAVRAERDPGRLPWRDLGVDTVFECTGRFTKRAAAASHLEAGAERVLVSAPCDGADLTVVMGVNQEELKPGHKVVSNASCTTNCLAPVVYVLQRGIGIERGYMTTIHAYTGDQNTVDTLHKDLRRAQAAALSMIPTSTGAARSVGLVLPALKGKLDGTAIRVPTANVSLIDLTFDAARETSREEVNTLMEEAAASDRLNGILGINKASKVSVDFNHDPHSAVFDVTQTQVLDRRFVRVLAWYDNEWASRCACSTSPHASAVGRERVGATGPKEGVFMPKFRTLDGRDVRLYREPEPAGDSVWLAFIEGRRIASPLVLSHLRHATDGRISLENTQPFARERDG